MLKLHTIIIHCKVIKYSKSYFMTLQCIMIVLEYSQVKRYTLVKSKIKYTRVFYGYTSISLSRAVGRSENPGVPVVGVI